MTSFEVQSFSPNGMRSVDAVALVGVYNPTVEFTISELKGMVRDGDHVIAYLEGAPVTVEKKSDLVYELPCSVTLDENLSLFFGDQRAAPYDNHVELCDPAGTSPWPVRNAFRLSPLLRQCFLPGSAG